MEPCKHKGLVMGLFANIPNFVIATLSMILIAIFLETGNDATYSAVLIFNTFTRLHEAMFLGIINAIAPASTAPGAINYDNLLISSILFAVLPYISVAVIHLAYWLGTKERKIFSFLSGKK